MRREAGEGEGGEGGSRSERDGGGGKGRKRRWWWWGGGEGTEQPGLPDVHFGTEACCARIISTAVTLFWFGAAR